MMIPKKQETFPPEMYSAPPDKIKVEYAIMRCRSCDQMSEWSEVPDDHHLGEAGFQWELNHEEETGHKRYYVFRVQRSTFNVL